MPFVKPPQTQQQEEEEEDTYLALGFIIGAGHSRQACFASEHAALKAAWRLRQEVSE